MSIEAQVIDYLKETFRLENISLEMSFRDDLGFDSLDLVDLVSFLEETINERISDEELLNLVTVNDVVQFLSDKGDGI